MQQSAFSKLMEEPPRILLTTTHSRKLAKYLHQYTTMRTKIRLPNSKMITILFLEQKLYAMKGIISRLNLALVLLALAILMMITVS